MAIHLGRSSPNASRDRPERRRGRPARQRRNPDAACRSYLVLLPVGFALPPPLPAARCALTAPFHPCRPYHPTKGWHRLGGVFLWHFPWGRPRRALPGTVPPWSPDFPLPAQAQEAAIRPSGTRRFGLSRRLCQRLLGRVSDFERSCAGQSRETTSRQGVEQWRRAESASAFRRFDHGRSPVAAGSAPPPSHSAG